MGLTTDERDELGLSAASGGAPPDDVVIRTRGLRKVYTDFWGRPRIVAVHGLDLDVHRGEVFGFLGPNGSGKTTTTKLLLGLLNPSAGSAHVLGHAPGDPRGNRRLGYLPEETYLYKFLNAEETLRFFGKMQGLSRAARRRRAEELMELVGLDRALRNDRKRPLKTYSKGMARRIGLAQALVGDPELVILDEPTSGLDPTGRREMKDLLAHLKSMGKTVFLCSHLLAEVQEVCDRIVIMNQGHAVTGGRLDDLARRDETTRLDIAGLTDRSRARLEAFLQSEGARIVGEAESTRSLEDLFLEAITGTATLGDSDTPNDKSK
jgi:ABC-2 type transport system ATP-binding protein